jgi:hypothetical protein
MHRATSEANMQATSVLTGHEIMDFYVSFFKMLAGLTQLQQIFLWLVLFILNTTSNSQRAMPTETNNS